MKKRKYLKFNYLFSTLKLMDEQISSKIDAFFFNKLMGILLKIIVSSSFLSNCELM